MWSPVISSSDLLDNNGPKKRCKHAVCLHMENIYMYGGKQGYRALKEFWKYDLINKIWEKIKSNGDHPPALQQHTMVPNGDQIYVFGGELCISAETPLWIYDIPQQSWSKYNSKSQRYSVNYTDYKNRIENNNKINNDESPSGRRGHSAVLMHPTCDTVNVDNEGSNMIVFGGFKETHGSTEELYCFDISEETWHIINPKEKVPPARHNHSAVVYDGYMWIYGGMTNLKEINDFWKYNIASNQWEHINVWQGPGYLHSHTAVVLNDNMIIFGGETQGALNNDIWKFSFHNGLWEKISCDIKPSPCSQLAAIAVPSYQIVEQTVSNLVYEEDIKSTNSGHSHSSGNSFGSSHGNEFEDDSFIEYNQHKLILSKPCDIPQFVESFSETLSPSHLNGSFKKHKKSKKSYIPNDKSILIHEMHDSPVDDSVYDIIDGEIEFSNLDQICGNKKGKISTCNEYFLDVTLQKNCKNDYFSVIDDYSDHNEYENKISRHSLRKNCYNEQINESFICDENTFEMQDLSNDNISNNSYKEDIQSIDLDTTFASKTITFCNVENQYKYNNNQQYDYENASCSSRDLMYIFCGKEVSQSSQITESLTIWEFDLNLKAN